MARGASVARRDCRPHQTDGSRADTTHRGESGHDTRPSSGSSLPCQKLCRLQGALEKTDRAGVCRRPRPRRRKSQLHQFLHDCPDLLLLRGFGMGALCQFFLMAEELSRENCFKHVLFAVRSTDALKTPDPVQSGVACLSREVTGEKIPQTLERLK